MKHYIIFAVITGLLVPLNALCMSRTIKATPAVVLAAFGTTTKARTTYQAIDRQLSSEEMFKKIPLHWAFTSEIVRERANKAFEKKGDPTRYLSLPQVLANLEAEGYRKVVIQPLHIFAGQEYDEVIQANKAFELLGMRIETGKTLLHDWPAVHEVVTILEKEFLPPDKGCNVIVTHGTPMAFHGVNSTYLGLDRFVSGKYQQTFVGAVEGILTREQALSKAKQCPHQAIRFIPLMLVAGDHIMNDIMAPQPEDNEISWYLEMKQSGFEVDTLTVRYSGETFYKGLGFNPEIVELFVRSMKNALVELEKH